ncbi:heavy metal translocating P-type ATPase [Desulfovibrio sp. JC010]|uniref:heavy metal translocating P-type ATPase n=1 Tax=Desulfovibrio sp. JC010 TaxID=2593641 RepID=UPI0013D81F62|nr:heavy metal translocating P-type ATPase [Desulfovibrio sp. JC010]NDV27417.1 heavy metal translocating P-type ATPase [Desulfovibrio sp. JC010]
MNQMISTRTFFPEEDLRVVHCIQGRIRVRCSGFSKVILNPDYVEAHVASFPGITKVRLNLYAGSLIVRHDRLEDIFAQLVHALNTLPVESFTAASNRGEPITRIAVGTHLLMAAATPFLPSLLQMHVAFSVGIPILWEGLKNLFSHGISAKSLDGFSAGLCLVLKNYPAVAVIGFMRILGDFLKQRNDIRSNELLVKLFRSRRKAVWVERDGVEVEISFDCVRCGDIAVFGAGELVAVDGEVVGGSAVVNKSMITGESIPVCLEIGGHAVSGSVVESGRLRVRADKVGAETSMSRINRFLEQAIQDKSLPELKGDRLADKLVPVTLGLSGATYALTGDLSRTASMASIDYVCSVKFPACFSVKSSIYAAARSGMLLAGGRPLDAFAKVDTVVFDKTGTLTRNLMQVTDVAPFGNRDSLEVLNLAARIEQHYEHPLAKAVVQEALSQGLQLSPVSDVEFVVSKGIRAMADGHEILVGSRGFVLQYCAPECPDIDRRADQLRSQGKIVLYVARGGEVIGLVAMRDTLRPESSEVIAELKRTGIKKVVVLTGDHCTTASRLKERLDGIDELHWELAPEDKASIVQDLKAQGAVVAVVGDGVNDAPALIAADLGICMGHGGELARLSAQAVIMNNDLRSICAARSIALRQHRILDHCYRQGAVVNTSLFALASAGLLAPLASTVLHNLNTFGLVGYSMFRAGRLESSKA